MPHIQELMKPRIYRELGGVEYQLPPIIKTKFKSTPFVSPPKCMACSLATLKARSPQVKRSRALQPREGALSVDQYNPGDCVASDQFVVKTPGRLTTGYGRNSDDNCYHGGTLYTDVSSGLVRVVPQVSLGAGETLLGKARFEEWIFNLAGVTVNRYHSDNGVYASPDFKQDCSDKDQVQSFSGVGAQHQNAHAERNIQTLSYWARTMMVHCALHWPSDNADELNLWPFAMEHAAWLYNRLPNRVSGLTPLEVFTRTKSDHQDLLRAHVWGCPVFVLDPKLQDGKKIPKWNRRSRLGQFLGFSEQHSSLVACVRNLSTGFVSPQYHVVFDDLFQTIYNDTSLEDSTAPSI
ncbi:hypothetical protein ACHAXS_003253, partial [Conticribra weissflogii]